jgi:hypothetical protein
MVLDDAALRLLFEEGGDDPERVWAAWALGMRKRPDMASLIHHAAAEEPSAGVRAHLALMLVAHGEIDAAAALARFDPDAVVRAAACRNLARVAAPENALLHALLAERLRDDRSADVRIAIMDAMRDDSPELLLARCTDLLSATEEEVRAAAIDSILRRAKKGVFPTPLRAHVRGESSSVLRTTLLDAWRAAEGVQPMVVEMGEWEAHHVVQILELVRQENVRLTPSELDPLLDRREHEITCALAELVEDNLFTPTLSWLSDVVLLAMDPNGAASGALWSAATIAVAALADTLENTPHAALSAGELTRVSRLRSTFEREWQRGGDSEELVLASIEGIGEDDDHPELVWRGIELLPVLRRLDMPMN